MSDDAVRDLLRKQAAEDETALDSPGDQASNPDDTGDEGSPESGDADAATEPGDAETPTTEEPQEDDPEGVTQIPGLASELKKLTPNMAKRVESLFKEVPALKGEIAALTEQVTKANSLPTPLSRSVADPLADVRSESELEAALTYAQEVKRFAKRNPDGGTFQGREIESDQLELMDDWADAALIAAPQRRKYLETYNQAAEFAKAVMPDLFKPTTPVGKAFAEWQKMSPGVVQNPAYVADFVCMARGANVLQAERDGYTWIKVKKGSAEEKAATKAQTRRPPASSPAATVPIRSATGAPVANPARQRAIESGDHDAIKQMLMAAIQ
jgi:hypothetical protein